MREDGSGLNCTRKLQGVCVCVSDFRLFLVVYIYELSCYGCSFVYVSAHFFVL